MPNCLLQPDFNKRCPDFPHVDLEPAGLYRGKNMVWNFTMSGFFGVQIGKFQGLFDKSSTLERADNALRELGRTQSDKCPQA